MGDACWRKVCVCFGATVTLVLFTFCHELFLHVVFVVVFFYSNTVFALISIFLCSRLELPVASGLFLTVLIGLIMNCYRAEWVASNPNPSLSLSGFPGGRTRASLALNRSIVVLQWF